MNEFLAYLRFSPRSKGDLIERFGVSKFYTYMSRYSHFIEKYGDTYKYTNPLNKKAKVRSDLLLKYEDSYMLADKLAECVILLDLISDGQKAKLENIKNEYEKKEMIQKWI